MSLQESSVLLPRVSSEPAELGFYGHHKHGLTIFTTAVFAVGEMAGSGVLALPLALLGTGLSTGLLLLVMCAFISAYTGKLLGDCWMLVLERFPDYRDHSRNPYPSIGLESFGKFGRILVSSSINFTLVGVSIVFLLIASENLQSLTNEAGGKEFSFCIWLLIVAGFLTPICWLGTPKDFWFIAVGAVIATSIACVLILVNIVVDSQDLPTTTAFHPPLNFETFFVSFGTISFAFGGHPAFPTFQADMRKPANFGKAVFLAYIVVLVMYLPVAVAGYEVYGMNLSSNVLSSVSKGGMKYTVTVLITLHLICSFIIVINPVCQEIEELCKIPHSFGPRRVILRTILTAFVLFVAESIPHFGIILSLIGASTTMLLAYILPPLFYLRLSSMEGDWDQKPAHLGTKVACVIIIVSGVLGAIASTYSGVKALFTSSFSKPCYIS